MTLYFIFINKANIITGIELLKIHKPKLSMSTSLIHPFRPQIIPPLFPKRVENEFARLNAAKSPAGLATTALSLIGKTQFQLRHRFHWETHFSVEYLGKGVAAANLFQNSLQSTIDLLSDMPYPPMDLIHALDYARQIDKNAIPHLSEFFGWPPVDQAPRIQQDITALHVGQYLAVPCNFRSHSSLISIACTDQNDTGEKKYRVTLHNTGEGFEQYHYSKTCSDGKIRFQTALEIDQISESDLCTGPFLAEMLKLNRSSSEGDIQKLYEQALPLLKGKILPPSQNPQLWSHGQLGGTCTTLCLLSFIRSQSSREWYKKFRDYGRAHVLLKGFRDIKKGVGKYNIQAMICLEMITDLQRSFVKRGSQLPPPLLETRRQLADFAQRKTAVATKKPVETDTIATPTITESIRGCITHLQSERWDALPDMLETMAAHVSRNKPHGRPAVQTEEDVSAFHKCIQELQAFWQDRILPAEHMYTIAAIAASCLKSGIDLSDKETEFCEQIVYESMFIKNKVETPKGMAVQRLLETLYQTWKGKIDDVTIPEGLKKIQYQMASV